MPTVTFAPVAEKQCFALGLLDCCLLVVTLGKKA
jgi:hypothetical protein